MIRSVSYMSVVYNNRLLAEMHCSFQMRPEHDSQRNYAMTGTTADTSGAADITAWQGLCCTMELATTCADDNTAGNRLIGGAATAIACQDTLSSLYFIVFNNSCWLISIRKSSVIVLPSRQYLQPFPRVQTRHLPLAGIVMVGAFDLYIINDR